MYIYIVMLRRWGDNETHSYLGGTFEKKEDAIKEADEVATYRGRKYAGIVYKSKLNNPKSRIEEVYRHESMAG